MLLKVAWTAFEQYRQVSLFHKRMRIALGQAPPPTSKKRISDFFQRWLRQSVPTEKASRNTDLEFATLAQPAIKPASGGPYTTSQHILKRRHSWKTCHSHYTCMGGFALDVGDPAVRLAGGSHLLQPMISPWSLCSLTKTSSYFQREVFPDLSEAQILDKCKASGLAKLLVCVQASWFCIQCFARLGLSHPISLLELTSVAHALCTLLVYVLWWDKPLDINEPTLIQGEAATELWAIATLNRISSLRCNPNNSLDEQPFTVSIQLRHATECYRPQRDRKKILEEARNQPNQPTIPFGSTRLYAGANLHNFHLVYYTKMLSSDDSFWDPSPPDRCFRFCDISATDAELLRHADKGWSNYGDHRVLDLMQRVPNRPDLFAASPYATRGTWGFSEPLFDQWPFLVSFSIAGLLYGGIHLTAWNATFSAAAHRILWRMSATAIFTSGPAFILILSINLVVRLGTWKRRNSYWQLFAMLGFMSVCCVYFVFYVFCRVCLIVECMISLAYTADAVFSIPSWLSYFPHIM
ncbi:hypothetical protein GQ44DRAFT_717787 [Phaeosphaeriaceae sp. PMI808]|nr:hypothetical protein GQ44DRAFT_717787 [Phaeosphaeriaceae sp. PMI808]